MKKDSKRMANKFYKLVYNMSAIAPLLIIFSIVWRIQNKSFAVCVMVILIAIIPSVFMLRLFSYAKNHLAQIRINANNVTPKDGLFFTYIFAYASPLASLVIDDINIWVWMIIGVAIIITAILANLVIPNPLLLLLGYHYYSVATENGISEYSLISKKIYRSNQELKMVGRIFDFLLLDLEGK